MIPTEVNHIAKPASSSRDDLPRLLILELWGIGDLCFATALLQQAVRQYRVTLVAKAHAAPLLSHSFPEVEFIVFDAPWTVFRGKYHLWRWPWAALWRLISFLRGCKFACGVSVRKDPRDHFLLWLAGVRARIGFPHRWSRPLLTAAIPGDVQRHRVEDWRLVGQTLELEGMGQANPALRTTDDAVAWARNAVGGTGKPILTIHTGARIAVRRWPEHSFATILAHIRDRYDVRLVLVPDPDGYGTGLASCCDVMIETMTLAQLTALTAQSHAFLCNDSGPGHIAAACGIPTITIFGPTNPTWFRPWGEQHLVVIRDLCEWRPCFDYCKYPEPYCMTRLDAETVWPDIQAHLDPIFSNHMNKR